MDRRKAIGILGSFGIIGCKPKRDIPFISDMPDTSLPAEIIDTPPSLAQIYSDGQTIKHPAGLIKVDGWTLLIDPDASSTYIQKRKEAENAEIELHISLIIPDEKNKTVTIGEYGCGNGILFDGIFYNAITYQPTRANEKTFLTILETRNGKVYKIDSVPVSFAVYHPEKKDDKRNHIFSEADLEAIVLQEIDSCYKTFTHLTQANVYIHKSKDEQMRSGEYNGNTDEVHLSSVVFTKPLFPLEGTMRLYHELCHAALQKLKVDTTDPRQMISLYSAYEKIAKQSNCTLPIKISFIGPPAFLEEDSLFTLFDESTYLNKLVGGEGIAEYGHPYSDYDELFASAMSVMRFFTEECISKYQKLRSADKRVAVKAGKIILNTFDYISQFAESFDPNVKIHVLPEYERLRKVFR